MNDNSPRTNPDGIGKPMQQDQEAIDRLRQQEEQEGETFRRRPGERTPGPSGGEDIGGPPTPNRRS